jgi:hypothetical protein
MDMEFEKLKAEMESVIVNTTAAREHVGDIERYIRVIKERGRSVSSQLPYKTSMPDQIVIHLIKFVVMWINALPHKNGVSSILSPREIVLRLKMDFKKHCRVKFGAYVEASPDDIITNTLRDRTEECIALGPTGNMQGSVACFNLDTGRVVTRRTITPLPMPDRIIRKVMKMGQRARQRRKQNMTLEFLDRRQRMFAWDDGAADIDEGLLEPDVSDTADIPAELPGIHLEDSVNGPEHTNTVVEAPPLPGWAVAEQVLTNANLAQTLQTDEITGVDSPNQPLFTDGSDSVGGDDGDGAFNEDPPDQGPPPLLELDETQAGEEDEASKDLFESEADDDANEEDEANDSEDREDGDLESPMMQRRYPLRHRTKKKQTVIDFDGRKYQTADGVIHINPSIIKDRREAFKKNRVYPTYGIENRPKVTIPTPKG